MKNVISKLTNSELLERAANSTPARLFTGLEQQRILLMRLALTPMPCPSCGVKQTELEAAGLKTVDDYDFGATKLVYHCVNCERELRHSVPFVAMGPPWHWDLVPLEFRKEEA